MSSCTSYSPIVLDFDGSVLPVDAGEQRIPLRNWQESIRYGCRCAALTRLTRMLETVLPAQHGPVFTGSGDFHHVTLCLLELLSRRFRSSFDIVVCDNHPDNMRYPFGVHCGSWVYHASRMECVHHIHVVGITSQDITVKHAWENYLGPFLADKLTYWSVGSNAEWLVLMGKRHSAYCHESTEALLEAFIPILKKMKYVYLSVDKDVFSEKIVRTNWDQGLFTLEQMEMLVASCRERLLGADITGDVSSYTYTSLFKRFLSRLDGQVVQSEQSVQNWQHEQQKVNSLLVAMLAAAHLV